MFNPVGPILEGLRSTVILHQSPELGWLAYSAAWAVLGLVSSWAIFKRSETSFAESI
jgi:ABC-type polysaccharide/polyol phosphate export permease